MVAFATGAREVVSSVVLLTPAGIVETTDVRRRVCERDRVIFPYRPGTSIKPRIAKKKTTL